MFGGSVVLSEKPWSLESGKTVEAQTFPLLAMCLWVSLALFPSLSLGFWICKMGRRVVPTLKGHLEE